MPTLDLSYQTVKHLDDTAIPFVLNSWLKSYRWSDKDNEDYYREIVPKIKELIRTNRVVVATLTEEPDCFVGWICGTKGRLHYCYVKSAFRRDGVAKELINKVCGLYGVYTFKSRNNAFLRYLYCKGFEYEDKRERDTGHRAKVPSVKGGRAKSDNEQSPVGTGNYASTGTGRRVDYVYESAHGGEVHPDR